MLWPQLRPAWLPWISACCRALLSGDNFHTDRGRLHPSSSHEQMCLAKSFAVPSHYEQKKEVADSIRFPKQTFLLFSLHSKHLLSSSCSSLCYMLAEWSELREHCSLHFSLICGSYHRFRPTWEKFRWLIILSITGETTSGSERSLMVGSNRDFHGKRPYRLWATSYPRISPGTAIHRGPGEQNCSVTPGKSLACGVQLSESTQSMDS